MIEKKDNIFCNFIWLSILLIVSFFATILFASEVKAIPAAPGVRHEGKVGMCRSHTAEEPVKVDNSESTKEASKYKKIVRIRNSNSSNRSIPLVFIVVGFRGEGDGKSYVPYNNEFNWNKTIFSGEKSLRQYYLDMSNNNFTFEPVAEKCAYDKETINKNERVNDGVIHVTINMGHDDWRSCEYEEYDSSYMAQKMEEEHMESLFKAIGESLEASGKYIDFGAYDSNKNGKIERTELAICFCFAGYEASLSDDFPEGVEKYIWSGAYEQDSIDIEFPKVNGLSLESFITIAEQFGREDGYKQAHIGTVAHELGHYIGLPDFYDVTYSNSAEWNGYCSSSLSLMDAGSWGKDANGNYSPYSLDAWSKYYLGWLKPNVAKYSMPDGVWSIGSKPLLIRTKKSSEYYLVENRRFENWDYGIRNEGYAGNKNGGLILWHVDEEVYKKYKSNNEVNVTSHRPAIVPLLGESSGNRYDFIGNTVEYKSEKGNNVGYFALFDKSGWDKKYKRTLGKNLDLPVYGYGKEADYKIGRTLSGIRLEFLTNSGKNMRIKLGKLRTEQVVKAEAGNKKVKLSWNAVNGANRYVIYMGSSAKNLKKIKIVGANKKRSWTKKGLKNNKKYYFRVVAEYRIGAGTNYSGKKGKSLIKTKTDGASKGYKKLRTSKVSQVITEVKASKFTNPKSIKLNKTKFVLKKGKKDKIKGSIKKKSIRKKLLPGGNKLSYISGDKQIVTVSNKGIITAKNKGTCTIYVQTINGIWKSVKVTVK